ncbi:glycoside hydrolase family 65 protein [Streptomonospora nanhaiensis]|uniref:Trehalose/maltose hydrolase-like predicted phosphorylase n=1 Tax=Streptomonospora nanhaiensis TaxID=1323731 RepID=A0A853BKC9_9ACTN|nr:glycoside hydrolase family 65 protein [Streptomonospora nanhaiensis]MBV2364147.1 glycoside hydrolase family 65 protein [Streptomonospora nanhaiensis]MBX9389458.1 glycoside hydrolase family 65 protein [Streptomonospora nanhaiensis]NYI95097.1 trehalose/maltose hydrolase-like predicted phosphorylase [Streptomonospora nanhaiensis]
MNPWRLVYRSPRPEDEGLREALCTLGNGYFATRGAAAEAVADGVRYPGSYISGCYDRAASSVGGHPVDNEDLVNVPNWLPLTFRAGREDWLAGGDPRLTEERVELDMLRGVLERVFRVRHHGGATTLVRQRRLVSMSDPHLAALEVSLLPENWDGELTVLSALDGGVANSGVARYRTLPGRHLRSLGSGGRTPEELWLRTATRASDVGIALAARTRVSRGAAPGSAAVRARGDWIGCELRLPAVLGQAVTLEKTVALHTSRDHAAGSPLSAARTSLARADSFDTLLRCHAAAWRRLWQRCSVDIDDQEDQRILRLHLFHILQTLSPHTADLDVGVPARGLHGEAYRGHVFWDELFVLPFLNLRFPETARGLLRYRWRRLPEARAAARAQGLRGAAFPWQSATTGREETQRWHLNPRSGRWLVDNSRLQRHVNIAVAYNVWQHYQATGDTRFLTDFGAELLLEAARTLADLAVYDHRLRRYVIRGVMGPDEYHDAYPGRDLPGVDDNAYTNVMTVWVLRRVPEVLDALPGPARRDLRERLDLSRAETDRFARMTRRMRVPFHDGVISQFAGYENLAELDWAGYRAAYGDIRRLDRILEAEGDTCNRYRAGKQADVLMLMYLLSEEELTATLHGLGYESDSALLARTVDYYLARTAHGSTLSSVVHAWVLARADRRASWRFLRDALRSDIDDVQRGTTAEGIHLGAMAGTVDLVTRCYTGLTIRDGRLCLDPVLPEEFGFLAFPLRFRGHWNVRLRFRAGGTEIGVPPSRLPPVPVRVRGQTVEAVPGMPVRLAAR